MAENKIISYDVELLSTNKRREFYIPEIYTNDLYSNEFQFNVLDVPVSDLVGATATVLLNMRDGSFFNNTDVIRSGNVFKYILKENEGNHFGIAKVQLVVVIGGKDYATPIYNFAVMQGLDDKKANEVVINDLNSETRKAINDLKAQWQQVIYETTGKDIVSAPEIIAARSGEPDLKTRIEKGEVTLFNDIPTVDDLGMGRIGAVYKKDVKLEVIHSFPKDGQVDVGVNHTLFFDLNMPVNEATVNSLTVRLFKGTEKIPLLLSFDKKLNRIVIIPTPSGGVLDANTIYKMEITDGVVATSGYRIGTSTMYRVTFKTGEARADTISEPMTDFANSGKLEVTTTLSATMTQGSGFATIDTLGGGKVTIVAEKTSRNAPYTVTYLIKPIVINGTTQFRMRIGARDYAVGITKDGFAIDVREQNVLNKKIPVNLQSFIKIKISALDKDTCHAWINGVKIPFLAYGSATGSDITIIADTPVKYELYDIKGGLYYDGGE